MSSDRKSQFRHEAATLFRLGGPLMVNNLAVAGMQFADAVMAGRLGTQSLAAVAVGASVWFLGFSMVLGVMMAISPIVARHFGAKRYDLVGRYTRQGMYLAVLFGVGITSFGNVFAEPLLTWFGIDEDFRALTVDYVAAISWGGAGIFMFLALRFTVEGIGHTRPIMYTSIFALVPKRPPPPTKNAPALVPGTKLFCETRSLGSQSGQPNTRSPKKCSLA